MKLDDAIRKLREGKSVNKKLIILWLEELKEYRENEKAERERELEKAGY